MRTCAMCNQSMQGKSAGAKYCSDTCRKRAHKRANATGTTPTGGTPATAPGESNEEAIRRLVAELERAGRLTESTQAIATLTINLAKSVDLDPRNSSLWREFRLAEQDLRAMVPDESANAMDALIASLMGDEG